MAQHLRAHGIGIAVSQRLISVVTLHLGLPVACQGRQHLLCLRAVQPADRHLSLLIYVLRIPDAQSAPVARAHAVSGHTSHATAIPYSVVCSNFAAGSIAPPCAHTLSLRSSAKPLSGSELFSRKRGEPPLMSIRSTPPAEHNTPSYTGPFVTVTVLYFIFGFITNLNMQLVPHLRSVFDLPGCKPHWRTAPFSPPTLSSRLPHRG